MPDQNEPMTKGDVTSTHPPLPPFTRETAIQKVRLAEDGWNSRDPERVSMAYTPDSRWRNRSEFISGRREIVAFLTRKWLKELGYRLIKELWAFDGNRIAVRFAYESHGSKLVRVVHIYPGLTSRNAFVTVPSLENPNDSKRVELRCNDEVISMQTSDLMRPESNCNASPLR